MRMSFKASWSALLIAAGATLVNPSGACGQEFQPMQRDVAPVAGMSAGPSWRDFDELTQRLQAAEQRLSEFDERAARFERLPPTSNASYYNENNAAIDLSSEAPSAAARIADLEKQVKAASEVKYPTARLSGFFHLDTGMFGQDAVNMATLGDIQDGTGFRRARLKAVGKVAEFTNYSLEMDFATAGRPSFMDVWGEQTNLPVLGNVRIGQFRQATTMDSLTPVTQLWFLERSLPFQAMDPFRRVGASAYDKSENELWSWMYGVYRTGAFNNAPLGDTRYAEDIGDNGGYSVAARLTHLLWYDEPTDGRYLLHVGGGYNYSRITGGTANGNSYEARAIPEFYVGDPSAGVLTANGTPFFVDTGRLAADQFHFYHAQIAGQYGAAHFQAEYMATVVDQIGNPNCFYHGAYAQAGYFLTGENYAYDKTFGVFSSLTPYTDFFSLGRDGGFCGWGAWETTARISYVDLNDPNAVPVVNLAVVPPTPNAGQLTNLTLGLNWYWNKTTKLQVNYIHCFLDNAVLGESDCDIVAGRFQVAF